MSLRIIMLRKQQSNAQEALDELLRSAEAYPTRESELEAAINQSATDEERGVVEAEVAALESEQAENATRSAELRTQIEALASQIREFEAAEEAVRKSPPSGRNERTENHMSFIPKTRSELLGMQPEIRTEFLARDDVHSFVTRFRAFQAESRSISGAELGVPEIFLDILRDTVSRSSKLIKYINPKPIKGKARQNTAGTVPEAIWTEAVGSLNELDIVFTQLEMDGYKVGGYLAIPNSDLEDDDDLQLLDTVLDYLGQSIGKAVDKAIPYGTGIKMPVGFITRLAATAQPLWWGINQGPFTDLHNSNILSLNISGKNGTEFFKTLIAALGVAKPAYSNGVAVWLMNRKTRLDVLTRALGFNLNSALVSGISNTMPVIGGEIVEDENFADYDIGGGFLSLEKWSERSGTTIRSSDIPLMVADQTVFVGTQRYDGKPAVGEAFVLVNYNNAAPKTSAVFGKDAANTDIGTLIVTTAADAVTAGKTVVNIAGGAAGKLKYRLGSQYVGVANGAKIGDGWTAIANGSSIAAETGSVISVVEYDENNRAIKTGFAFVTAKA